MVAPFISTHVLDYTCKHWFSSINFFLCSLSVPAAGFTQRATIDPDLNEIHVLSVGIQYLFMVQCLALLPIVVDFSVCYVCYVYAIF